MADEPEVHPILLRDVVQRDGSRKIAFRVDCPRSEQSVPLHTCEVCPSCVDVVATGDGVEASVRCTPVATLDPSADRASEAAAEAILSQTVLCVEGDVDRTAVIALFVEQALPAVFVVDEGGKLLGAIREIDLTRNPFSSVLSQPNGIAELLADQNPARTAATTMSSAVAVPEDAPVKAAILRMAGFHARQVAVVTRTGELVGVLRDLDALRWMAAHARARR